MSTTPLTDDIDWDPFGYFDPGLNISYFNLPATLQLPPARPFNLDLQDHLMHKRVHFPSGTYFDKLMLTPSKRPTKKRHNFDISETLTEYTSPLYALHSSDYWIRRHSIPEAYFVPYDFEDWPAHLRDRVTDPAVAQNYRLPSVYYVPSVDKTTHTSKPIYVLPVSDFTSPKKPEVAALFMQLSLICRHEGHSFVLLSEDNLLQLPLANDVLLHTIYRAFQTRQTTVLFTAANNKHTLVPTDIDSLIQASRTLAKKFDKPSAPPTLPSPSLPLELPDQAAVKTYPAGDDSYVLIHSITDKHRPYVAHVILFSELTPTVCNRRQTFSKKRNSTLRTNGYSVIHGEYSDEALGSVDILEYKPLIQLFQLSAQQVLQVASVWLSELAKREFTSQSLKAHYAIVTDSLNDLGLPYLLTNMFAYLQNPVPHSDLGLVRTPGYTADLKPCLEDLYKNHPFVSKIEYPSFMPDTLMILRNLLQDKCSISSPEDHTFFTTVLCDFIRFSANDLPFEKVLIIQYLNYTTNVWCPGLVQDRLIKPSVLQQIVDNVFDFHHADLVTGRLTMEELLYRVAPAAFTIKTAPVPYGEKFILHPDSMVEVCEKFSINLFAFLRLMVGPHERAGSFFTLPMLAFLKLQVAHKRHFPFITIRSSSSDDSSD